MPPAPKALDQGQSPLWDGRFSYGGNEVLRHICGPDRPVEHHYPVEQLGSLVFGEREVPRVVGGGRSVAGCLSDGIELLARIGDVFTASLGFE